jgi:hypothetical protein
MDAVADVDVNLADISGDLGVNLHLLKGQKLSRDFKPIRKWSAPHAHHGRNGLSDLGR